MQRCVWLLLISFWSCAAFAEDLDFARCVRDLIDLQALTRLEGPPTKMISSYDRTGANEDGYNSEWLRGDAYVLADLTGPGVIRRMWTARVGGRLQVFLDGALEPAIDVPCVDFFNGTHPSFPRPVAGPMGGSNYSYFPIPFARSIRIQLLPDAAWKAMNPLAGPYGQYHHVTYQTLPAGTPVRSLQMPLPPADQKALDEVLHAWRNLGSDPKPPAKNSSVVDQELEIAPAASESVCDLTGPGTIDRIHLALRSDDPHFLRTTLLRIRWDDQRFEAVDCPVGDFFANGFHQIPFRSLPIGLQDEEYYCYLSMPFASRARLLIVNESAESPVTIRLRLSYHATSQMDPAAGYFHAKWRRQEVEAVNLNMSSRHADYDYHILDATGRGRYIGASLNVFNRHFFWWGEGDHRVFIDEDSWPPSQHGTGTEEYFNDGWGFHDTIFAPGSDPGKKEQNVVPVSGVLLPGLGSGQYWGPNAVFVFHVSDSVPFRKRILVTLEHGTENNLTNDYSSTAYWYARPDAQDFFVMRPARERLTVPPRDWTELRTKEYALFLADLRQQLAAVAAVLATSPTDGSLHRDRIWLIRRLLRNAGELGIPAEKSALWQKELDAARQGPIEERWPVMDKILQEFSQAVRPEPQ
jgi:hypothetical protein